MIGKFEENKIQCRKKHTHRNSVIRVVTDMPYWNLAQITLKKVGVKLQALSKILRNIRQNFL